MAAAFYGGCAMISVERLKELLQYFPETGIFIRIKVGAPGNQRKYIMANLLRDMIYDNCSGN